MCLIHDVVPLQMALTFRHFIDFFHQATAKEHSESSLSAMKKSLKKYYKHSAIMEPFSSVSCFKDLTTSSKYVCSLRITIHIFVAESNALPEESCAFKVC